MMRTSSIIRHRSIKELIDSKHGDQTKLKSLCHNPLISEFSCSLLEYVIDGEVAGQVTTLPIEVVAYNSIFQVCGGSGLSVETKFRGRGIAGELTKERMCLSRDKIAIASGLSSMSFPLFKKLGFVTFKYPRLIYLKRSRSVLEMFFKGFLLRMASSLVDVFLRFNARLLRCFSIYTKRGIRIEEVFEATEDIARIVAEDNHPFRENHTKEWFDWVLHYPFSNDERSKQHLFQIWIDGKVQAFFMTKERFHEQASHRGFKNVILGSVIEWGVLPDSTVTELQICKAAILSFGKHVDAVEICLNNNKLIRSLKMMGMIQVGDSNMAIKATKDSPLQYYKDKISLIDNWRIRPAYSDNGLS